MNFTLLTAYLISIVLLIATPGPVVALVLNTASREGVRQAVLTVLGTNWASLILIATATLVISGLLSINNMFLTGISLIGCVFIAWLAINGLRSELLARDQNSRKTDHLKTFPTRKASSAIINGFLVGISNPKDIFFFVAFFPQFIGITNEFKVSLIVLTLLWITLDFIILFGYATMINTEEFQRRRTLISILSSSFLLLVAVAGFVYSAHEILA